MLPFSLYPRTWMLKWFAPTIGELVNEPGVAVKVEDHRLILGEERVEVTIGQSVRMFRIRLQPIQIHDIDETNLEIRETLPKNGHGSQRFLGQNVTSARHNDIRLTSRVVARPLPDSDSFGAVNDRSFHIEVYEVLLLVGDDHIHVILTT